MQKFVIIVLVVVLFIFCEGNSKKVGEKLILLKNNQIEVGVLTHLGGRVVLLRKPGKENIIKSDSSTWEDLSIVPPAKADSDFKTFNGHIVWVSPQSEWWSQQEVNQKRKQRKANWPPDPYLIYGQCEVIEKTDTSVTLRGEKSPVSGVQITKKIEILSDGQVKFQATIRNIREDSVKWGIWMNTRLSGYARCYVPANEKSMIRKNDINNQHAREMPYEFVDGYFTFCPHKVKDLKKINVQKTYFMPEDNYVVGFDQGQALKISFDPVLQEQLHSEHGLVEIYNNVNSKDDLLELEVQGEYKLIAPDEELTMNITWELFDYQGDKNSETQIQFIEDSIK